MFEKLQRDVERGTDVLLAFVLIPVCMAVVCIIASPMLIPALIIGILTRHKD